MFQYFITVVCIFGGNVSYSTAEDWTKDYRKCSKDVIQLGNSCYQFPSVRQNWKKAKDMCIKDHRNLIQPETREENERMKTYLTQSFPGNSYWIGIQQIKLSGQFRFLTTKKISYTDWGASPPQLYNIKTKCVMYDGAKQFKWMNTLCRKRQLCICELKECPADCGNETKPGSMPMTTQAMSTQELVSEPMILILPVTTALAKSQINSITFLSNTVSENSTRTSFKTSTSKINQKTSTATNKRSPGNGKIRGKHNNSGTEACVVSGLLQIIAIATICANWIDSL